MRTRAKLLFLIAVLAVIAVASVSAGTIAPGVVFALLPNNQGSTVQLHKFDPSLGTLKGVTLQFERTSKAEIEVDHAAGGRTVSWDLSAVVQFSTPGQIMLINPNKSYLFVWPAGPGGTTPSRPASGPMRACPWCQL